MRDESLFILKGLKEVRIKCAFGDVVEHLDFLVHVALPDDAPVALGHVAGLPTNIQMMHRHKPRLDVGACPIFAVLPSKTRTSPERTLENKAAFRLGVGVVDKLDLVFRHTGGNQLFANVLIDIEVAIVLWCREVAEQKLVNFCSLPSSQIFNTF